MHLLMFINRFHVSCSVFPVSFQSVCDSGKQGREPGRPDQTGPGAAQVLHERDGMKCVLK